MNKFLISVAGLTLSSTAALAHPGDHAFSMLNSLVHLLTEPDHLAMLMAAAALVGVILYKRKRRSV